MALAKLKALLREAAARSVQAHQCRDRRRWTP
jgi:hypothetical protein